MGKEELEEETELTELVDNLVIGIDPHCCTSSALSNISTNIEAIEEAMCNINSSYSELLKRQILKAFKDKRETGNGGLTRSDTQNTWYEQFKDIYIWQRYQESDLYRSMRYLFDNQTYSDPDNVDLDSISNPLIKRAINEYIYKIICGHFTKANICYAIYNYGRAFRPIHNEEPQDYIYLERCINLLSCTITSVNNELKNQWYNYLHEDMDMSSYVLSGGNIFYVFAGVLCYLNDSVEEHNMLEGIKRDINEYLTEYELYDDFNNDLDALFREGDFIGNTQNILANPSDIDCLFLSRHRSYVTSHSNAQSISKKISLLSASVLRSLLQTAHTDRSDYVTNLFPFIGLYEQSTWGPGKFYNTQGINVGDSPKLNRIGTMKNYPGYRQTSSYISELPIYLNRLKQGYFPFNRNGNPDSIAQRCIENPDKQIEYMTKFGECVDLSIGSTTNGLYNMKYEHYLEGQYYSMECLSSELEYIAQHTNDDKSSKRLIRQRFLGRLQEHKYSHVFDYILVTIFAHIHNWDGEYYGYPCPVYDTDEEQIDHDKMMYTDNSL